MSLFSIIKNLNLFKRQEEEPQYPPRFAIIKLNDVAKSEGINDELNKIIQLYEYGELVETFPYSKSHVDALRKIDQIPVVEEGEEDEDFEWDSITSFGVLTEKK